MSTVACDGKMIAADGRMCSEGQYVVSERHRKVFLLSDGEVCGVAGDPRAVRDFLEWASGDRSEPFTHRKEMAALILTTGGLLALDNFGACEEVDIPFAVGSGASFAIGAMEHGATAEEAVRIACKRDNQTGGEISHIYQAGA